MEVICIADMPHENYSPETQVHWKDLVIGKEYIQYGLGGGTGPFRRIVYMKFIAEPCGTDGGWIIGKDEAFAFAVGDWVEVPGGPKNRFWNAETPFPPGEITSSND